MIRIRNDQWISLNSIESVFIRDGDFLIVPNSEVMLPYLVEEKFFVDVCSALSLPYEAILGIISRQKQGEQDEKEKD